MKTKGEPTIKTEKQQKLEGLIKATSTLQSVSSREIQVITPSNPQPNNVYIQAIGFQLCFLLFIVLILHIILLIRIRDK